MLALASSLGGGNEPSQGCHSIQLGFLAPLDVGPYAIAHCHDQGHAHHTYPHFET